jgi:hypothetical protein
MRMQYNFCDCFIKKIKRIYFAGLVKQGDQLKNNTYLYSRIFDRKFENALKILNFQNKDNTIFSRIKLKMSIFYRHILTF